MDDWRGKHFAYFQNRACECFPCHQDADETDFNCIFCHCPLYALGKDCGGKFRYTPEGVKDCSLCLLPHHRENYGLICDRFAEICKRMRQLEEV